MPRLFSGKVILYLLFLVILDVSLMPDFGIFRPVLTYLWVLYVAFHHPSETLPVSVLAGLLRDGVSSQPLGTETAALVMVSMGLLFVMQKLGHQFFPMRLALTAVFVFSGMLMNLMLSSFLSSAPQFSWAAVFSCFAAAFASTLAMPVFFYGTKKWFHEGSRDLKQYELFG